MQMKKAYIAALALIALTALKLSLPTAAELMTERVSAVMESGADYINIVRAMGRSMTQAEASGELRQALSVALSGERINGKTVSGSSEAVAAGTAVRTYTVRSSRSGSEAEDGGAPEQTPAAVSAFLKSQASFKGYAIPVNVRTDMPSLPFEFISPVEGVNSSGFGYRRHPIRDEIIFHYGTDLAAAEGEPVRAFADGYIYAAGSSDSYGNYYIVTHKGGYTSLYAHLSEFVALEGETIKMGQELGRVGRTGDATGPHLHFELSVNDMYINPEYYI